MKLDLTSINVVLDRSGSMASVRADTIGGFNTFLDAQRELPGDATVTLAQFDDQYEIVYDRAPLATVPALDMTTYVPRGGTALLDAIGRTIATIGAQLAATCEADRPARVIVVVLTDGAENRSCTYSAARVREMIQHHSTSYAWEFVFLGANMDAVGEAARLGIRRENAAGFCADAAGTAEAFRAINRGVGSFRAVGRADINRAKG